MASPSFLCTLPTDPVPPAFVALAEVYHKTVAAGRELDLVPPQGRSKYAGRWRALCRDLRSALDDDEMNGVFDEGEAPGYAICIMVRAFLLLI